MILKSSTLVGAIASLILGVCHTIDFLQFLQDPDRHASFLTYISWPTGILFQLNAAVFFFVLFARQTRK